MACLPGAEDGVGLPPISRRFVVKCRGLLRMEKRKLSHAVCRGPLFGNNVGGYFLCVASPGE